MGKYFKPFSIKYAVEPPEFNPRQLEIRRTLEDCSTIFNDQLAVKRILHEEKRNPVLIDVYMAPIPEEPEHSMVLMTRIYPGKVGNEFFMTKGHIHKSDKAPEVYITLQGKGRLILQTPNNSLHICDMSTGEINYIPSGWAHRAVNTGSNELIFLGVYPADSSRDYSFIGLGKRNFGKLVIENESKNVEIVDNPNWKR